MSDSFEASSETGAGNAVEPSAEVLGDDTVLAAPRKRGRVAVVAGTVAVAAVLGVGVAVGMALSGGGTQPEDVVPAGAVMFADLDLDPSAGQKVNALRFLRSFPEVDKKLGAGDDFQQSIVDAVFADSDINAATQLDPWLGSRFGVAVLSVDGKAEPMVVLQTTDADAARASLPDLLKGDAEFTIVDDYVVIAETQQKAEQFAAQGASNPLSGSTEFQDAVGSLGDGVATLYVDQAGLGELAQDGLSGLGGFTGLGSFGTTGSSVLSGQLGAVLRFQPDALEVVGSADTSVSALQDRTETLVAGLPDTTLLALGFVGGADNVDAEWASVADSFGAVTGGDFAAQVEQEFGIRLPADLKTLLGDDFVVAVDGEDLFGGTNAGVRSITDPIAAADLANRMQPLIDEATAGFGVVVEPTEDGLVMATTPDYANQLAAGDGGLGATQAFTRAVPNANGAQAVAFVDLNAYTRAVATLDPNVDDTFAGLQALGLSVSVSDGRSDMLLRVTLS